MQQSLNGKLRVPEGTEEESSFFTWGSFFRHLPGLFDKLIWHITLSYQISHPLDWPSSIRQLPVLFSGHIADTYMSNLLSHPPTQCLSPGICQKSWPCHFAYTCFLSYSLTTASCSSGDYQVFIWYPCFIHIFYPSYSFSMLHYVHTLAQIWFDWRLLHCQ